MFRKLFATILVTAVGAGVGFAGAKFQPTQWQASAQFEQPRIVELGNYFSLFSTYYLISGDAVATDLGKMETKAAQTSYAEFKKNIQSQEKLIQFLEALDTIKTRAQIESETVQALAKKMSQQFQFKLGTHQADELVVVSLNSQEIDKLFGEYLRYINQQTRDTLNNDLVTRWKSLFQQVKSAADAKLDASWENKLKMMTSVQPLDGKLVAFHFVKNPTITAVPKPYIEWTLFGAGAGFILGLLLILILSSSRKPQD